MKENDGDFHQNVSSEGSEMNGKDASYRQAPLVSEPRLIPKLRIRGGLVPMRRQE